MNNYQKYENELKNIIISTMNNCEPLCKFISQHCHTGIDCETADSAACDICIKRFREWLDKEYTVELTKFEAEALNNLKICYHYVTKDPCDNCITVWENYPYYDSGAGYWVANSNDPGTYAIVDCFPNFLSSLRSDKVYNIDDLLNI